MEFAIRWLVGVHDLSLASHGVKQTYLKVETSTDKQKRGKDVKITIKFGVSSVSHSHKKRLGEPNSV